MKFVDEFRDRKLCVQAAEKIKEIAPAGRINLMEVCGTHTQSFFRFGLDKLLPANIRLISGPGCPVCVSSAGYIDEAIAIAGAKDRIILSFGDMLRVPGSSLSLERERANGRDIRIVYSVQDALDLSRLHPRKKVVFLAVGFETTAATIALSILEAKKEGLRNLFFLSSLKLIPAAMEYLVRDPKLVVDGFLCPGHVSAIIGQKPYEPIARKWGLGCCIAGFEPLDILEGVYLLLRQINSGKPRVENQYSRVVNRTGNLRALAAIKKVFTVAGADWRGLGQIPGSGLKLRRQFSRFDARKAFGLNPTTHSAQRTTQCRCGDVLKGIIRPDECPLFAKRCGPRNPVGPCMVSSEGACNAYYKYRK